MANNSGDGGGFRIRHLLLHRLKKDPESRNPLIPPGRKAAAAKKGGGLASAFRGLGCASASDAAPPHAESSSSAAVAAVRSSADWKGRRSGRKKKRRTRGAQRHYHAPEAGVADVSDFWCAPGVVFGSEPPVDCVVSHRNRGERAHRERACNVRQEGGGDNEVRLSSLPDSPSPITVDTPLFGSDALRSGHLRYARGLGHQPSPAEFEETMMFQTRVLGGMDVHDQYKDLRLDVDNMSYEELLELSEKIGSVSTGLREEEIFRNLRKTKQSFFNLSSIQKELKCIICQEEYEGNDDMGRLECGHTYHTCCIKQWLLQKNACPVCKTAMTRS